MIRFGMDEANIFKLLIVVGATIFLLGVNLSDNRINLVSKFPPDFLEIDICPGLRALLYCKTKDVLVTSGEETYPLTFSRSDYFKN